MEAYNPVQSSDKSFKRNADILVALAGNANTGKSVIFNQLTGVGQIVGNWPGKTVERAEGMLLHDGLKIKVIDLPGIYSFSTYSMEELVSREFIALEKPDIVVNVIDATALERNLFFTIQLIELDAPMIIALNQVDLMEKRGISIDYEKFEDILGVPVVPTVAIKGKGIAQLTDLITSDINEKRVPLKMKYGKEVEQRIEQLVHLLEKIDIGYPSRWVAIKLLEKDEVIIEQVRKVDKTIVDAAETLANELEKIHGEPSSIIVSSERYHIADDIARKVQMIGAPGSTLADKVDRIALHPVLGYFMIIAVIGGLLIWTFIVGAKISSLLSDLLRPIEQLQPVLSGPLGDILWNGAFAGLVAGLTLVIPYVLPFYIMLALIEDSGYLTRISVMLDRGMHKIGTTWQGYNTAHSWATDVMCPHVTHAELWRPRSRSF